MTTYTQTPLVSRIYTSRNVLLEYLKKQGYDISNEENLSISQIHSKKENEELDMFLEKEDQRTYVKYHFDSTGKPKKLQANHIADYIEEIFNIEELLKKSDNLVIIVNDKINDTIKKVIEESYYDGYFIIVFTLEQLSYNIMNHVLVPPHKVLSNEEKETIKEKYNIVDESQFPEISRFEPVAKVIGLRPGQLCEIKRKSKTAITNNYYRLCC